MNSQRAVAFSLQLRQAHEYLAGQLAGLREHLGGDGTAETALEIHCLAFCAALTAHHEGENGGMFTDLLQARPDLAPAIRKLVEDHAAISAIMGQVRALVTQAQATPPDDLPRLRRELDGLAAIMESHFRYEERSIGAALDGEVPDTGW